MQDLETELLSYPYGQTDDIVDSIALALTVGGSGYDFEPAELVMTVSRSNL